jgi:hypothetical protein
VNITGSGSYLITGISSTPVKASNSTTSIYGSRHKPSLLFSSRQILRLFVPLRHDKKKEQEDEE